MRNWNTGDRVTDSNLEALDNMADCARRMEARSLIDLVRTVIGIDDMLPKCVKVHFKFPNLYFGSQADGWSPERRAEFLGKLSEAIKDGLANAESDTNLVKGGGADYSDRPKSRGEAIQEALNAYENTRTRTDLYQLQMAASPTHLASRVKTIEMLSTRKRPHGNQSPEAALLAEISRLEMEASRMHGIKAEGR